MPNVPSTLHLVDKRAVYSGGDWTVSFGATEDGGRGVDDLVLNGTTTATSATAAFTTGDNGKKIATADGTGITDGTTMTYVNATTITLSAAATGSGRFVASIRALDASVYTIQSAKAKRSAGGLLVCTFTIDKTRAAVGWHKFSLPGATSEPLSGRGVWDWRLTKAAGADPTYWLAGQVHFVANTTECP